MSEPGITAHEPATAPEVAPVEVPAVETTAETPAVSARGLDVRTTLGKQKEAADIVGEALQVHRDALEKADGIVSDAEAAAATIEQDARAEAEQRIAAANAEAEQTLSSARAEAERILSEAQEKAEEVQRQADDDTEYLIGDLGTAVAALRDALDHSRASVAEAEHSLAQVRATRSARKANAELAASGEPPATEGGAHAAPAPGVPDAWPTAESTEPAAPAAAPYWETAPPPSGTAIEDDSDTNRRFFRGRK